MRDRFREVDRRLVVFSFASMVLMMGAGIISPILPLYATEFGVSYTGAGALVSAFALGRFFFDYVGGTLSDRVSARWMAGGGAALTALSSLLCAMAQSFPMLVVYRALEGIGSAFYVTTAMAFITRTVTAAQMGRVMGFYQGMLLLGVSVGPGIGGAIAQAAGLRAPFLAYAILSSLVAAGAGWLVADIPPAPRSSSGESDQAVGRLLRDRAFVFALLLTMVIFIIRAGLRLNLIPLFAHEVVGLNEFWVGMTLTITAFVNFLVLWHAGSLIDRRGRRTVVLPILAATALVVAAFPFATTFWTLLVDAGFLGATLGYLAPAPAAIIADVTPAVASGRAMGLYRMAADFGLLIGPLLFGWIASDKGFAAAFFAGAALSALVMLIGLRTRETLRRHARVELSPGRLPPA
jgi:MFS family permease